jgi:hypothetical protein
MNQFESGTKYFLILMQAGNPIYAAPRASRHTYQLNTLGAD